MDIELKQFTLLKEKIGVRLAETKRVTSADVSIWKGKEILELQNHLMETVNGRISEKWFYTHIKSANEKLPRIDMLNLLSKYVGFDDWDQFQQSVSLELDNQSTVSKSKGWRYVLGFGGLIILVVIALVFLIDKPLYQYQFCFVDLDMKSPVIQSVEVELLRKGESSLFYNTGENGCLSVESSEEEVTLVVRSPYYHTDTIVRNIKDPLTAEEQVRLKTNDYALMIHYFSTSNLKDWEARREQLDKMLHNDIVIYHIQSEGSLSMEMYNKDEFIDRLTMPTRSLKNMEIIATEYLEGQISALRFFVRKEVEHE